jgi:hypothetical protein
LGSKLEKTSFLKSLFIGSLAVEGQATKLQSEHSFPKKFQPRF